jgi:choline dehydrogenase-like flavoprotein
MSKQEEYTTIIVGAGLSGGIVAGVLAEAGQTVLLLERGKHFRSPAEVSRDHLRNHRLAQYGYNVGPGPGGNPRVFVDPSGTEHLVEKPIDGRWNNNAMGVGGGGLVYGAQAWRFLPEDFRMASTYGTPEGSSLADWPISYDDLEPYYTQAEQEIGVAGDAAQMPLWTRRSAPYPLPPFPDNPSRRVLRTAADKLGWATHPVPLAINTRPYNGRQACVHCGECVGFSCPTDAKSGSHNTLLPRGLATGRVTLVPGAYAAQIDTDSAGKVIGVTYFTYAADGSLTTCQARAQNVVLAAGAIETARLLLLSRSAKHPQGLGNHSDQVGRHVQGHYYAGATGFMEEPVFDNQGPGVTIATTAFNHHNPNVIGGGMLANDFIMTPITFRKWTYPAKLPSWGLACKRAMRELYPRVIQARGPVQEIPSPECRVTLDPVVTDGRGLPVARMSGTTHRETARTAKYMAGRATEWLNAAGARDICTDQFGLHFSAGQHQAGTARMGADPATSVTDPSGQVWHHENLYVADASLHVTNGGFNPCLTLMALAFRTARQMIGD